MSTLIGSQIASCPPKEATKQSAVLYRLLQSGTLNANDFKSRAELGKGNVNNCNEWAVSLTVTLEGAKKLIKMYPKQYAVAKVAKVNITESCGVAHQNKHDHVNWWHPANFDPLQISEMVEEAGGAA